jgi:hypothetical protein
MKLESEHQSTYKLTLTEVSFENVKHLAYLLEKGADQISWPGDPRVLLATEFVNQLHQKFSF